MKRAKFLSRIILAASLSLAMAFTLSCSSDDDGNGNSGGGSPVTGGADGGGNQFSQVYYMHYGEHDVCNIGEAYKGNGDIKMYYKDDQGNTHSIGDAGSINNGVAKLDLPKNIPNGYLKDFLNDDKQLSCANYPKDIKVVKVSWFELTNNNNDIGSLRIEDCPGTIGYWERMNYWYFSKAGKITCNLSYDGDRIINIIDIDAKAGWNKIYYRSYDTDADYTSEYSTKNILTKEKNLKWGLYQDY